MTSFFFARLFHSKAMGMLVLAGLLYRAPSLAAAPNKPASPAKKTAAPPPSPVKPSSPKVAPAKPARNIPEVLRFSAPQKPSADGALQVGAMQLKADKPLPGRVAITSYTRTGDKITGTRLSIYTPRADGTNAANGGTNAANDASWAVYEAQRLGPNTAYHVLSKPQFSPDGRYVLFQFGQLLNSLNSHWLYVFDTQTQALKMLPIGANYDIASWSPDGNYIAFIQGGDKQGGTTILADIYVGPLVLCVCNWRTGETYTVATNDTVNSPFTWLAPHTLLYSMLTKEDEKLFWKQYSAPEEEKARWLDPAVAAKRTVPRPNIYAYSVEKQTSRVVIKDGISPLPSPDGKRIAFYGSDDPKHPVPLGNFWNSLSHGAALSVARIDGSERTALDIEYDQYARLLWRPDNKHLLTLKQTKGSPEAEAEIREWDIASQEFRFVTKLFAQDLKEVRGSFSSPKFELLSLSKDGSTLFVSATEWMTEDPVTRVIKGRLLVDAVDVGTGSMQRLAEVKGDSGFDFYPQSSPASSTPSAASAR